MLRKRCLPVENAVKMVSGDETGGVILGKVLKRTPVDERKDILEELGLSCELDGKDGLAMMADLNMSWNTYRKWGRYVYVLILF